MNLAELTESQLESYPLCGVVFVAIRAAQRVLPIYSIWRESPGDNKLLREALDHSAEVIRGIRSPSTLIIHAETAYRLAAAAASEFRRHQSPPAGRAAVAGSIIHSALDALADLDADARASLVNSMLALRSVGKLQDEILSNAVLQDLRCLESVSTSRREMQTAGLDPFERLWPSGAPAWYAQ